MSKEHQDAFFFDESAPSSARTSHLESEPSPELMTDVAFVRRIYRTLPSESQEGFAFDESVAIGDTPDPLTDFFAEITQAWGIPLGERVRVRLHDATLPELEGKLKLTRAPNLPLDPREPLSLVLCGIEFNHRAIASWTLV